MSETKYFILQRYTTPDATVSFFRGEPGFCDWSVIAKIPQGKLPVDKGITLQPGEEYEGYACFRRPAGSRGQGYLAKFRNYARLIRPINVGGLNSAWAKGQFAGRKIEAVYGR